ncbi:hypothetical protein J4443_02255 [Candidatus Woesearchaeota archaeon]|nr:hypothetical protein [Candidatus Woesearchaeota archaeon]
MSDLTLRAEPLTKELIAISKERSIREMAMSYICYPYDFRELSESEFRCIEERYRLR